MEKYRKKDVISDKELSEFEHIEINKIKTSISNIGTSKIDWRKYLSTALPVSLLSTLFIVITIAIGSNIPQSAINDSNINYNNDDPVNTVLGGSNGPNLTDGTIGVDGVDGISVIRFFSFEEMLNCEYCRFVQGRVISRSSYNVFVDKIYLEVIISGFDDESEIINISIESGSRRVNVGDLYILNLTYTESHDYYSFSQEIDGIFGIVNNSVIIPDRFINDNIPTDLDEFLLYIELTE